MQSLQSFVLSVLVLRKMHEQPRTRSLAARVQNYELCYSEKPGVCAEFFEALREKHGCCDAA